MGIKGDFVLKVCSNLQRARAKSGNKVKTARAKRQKKPKHPSETRAYVFALEVDEQQSGALHAVRTACWKMRNQLTEERRANRALVHEAKVKVGQKPNAQGAHSITYLTRADQYKSVAALAVSEPFYAQIHSQVLQNIAVRVEEGTKRWIEALAEGRHHVRPPGPIALKRYKSITFPQYGNGVQIRHGKLHLSKLGAFKLLAHLKIKGRKKSVTVKWRDGRWWAVITTKLQAANLYEPQSSWAKKPDAGSDPGLKVALPLADWPARSTLCSSCWPIAGWPVKPLTRLWAPSDRPWSVNWDPSALRTWRTTGPGSAATVKPVYAASQSLKPWRNVSIDARLATSNVIGT
jgi:hypothetical protein